MQRGTGEAEFMARDGELGGAVVGRFGATGGALRVWNLLGPTGEVVGRIEAGGEPGGARRYYYKDALGSVRAVADASGAVVEGRDYYPFGLQMPGRVYVQGSETKEGFTGHELDSETGLIYAGSRYYMPAIGRWMTVDPILSRLSPKALLETDTRLLSMSPYNYVFNNPTNLTDPDGECPVCLVVWGVVEVGLFAYDVYDAYKTSTDPNASGLDKGISVGGLAASFFLPGGGYSSLDNLGRTGFRVLREGTERAIPLGFKNASEFADFGSSLYSGLKNAGVDDAVALFQGSSVTGKSFRTGQAFDVGRTSDFDVALASPQLLAKAKELGIGLRSQGARTGPLSRSDLEKLGLTDLARQLSEQAGRRVNFMIFESVETATERAASIGIVR